MYSETETKAWDSENLKVDSLVGKQTSKQTLKTKTSLGAGREQTKRIKFLKIMVTVYWALTCARHKVENTPQNLSSVSGGQVRLSPGELRGMTSPPPLVLMEAPSSLPTGSLAYLRVSLYLGLLTCLSQFYKDHLGLDDSLAGLPKRD